MTSLGVGLSEKVSGAPFCVDCGFCVFFRGFCAKNLNVGGVVMVGMSKSDARAELDSLGIDYTDVDKFFDLLEEGALALGGAGNFAVVKLFVVAGMDVDAKDRDGGTALHWAADRGRLDIVKFLKCAGASLRDRDDAGLTPRGRAVRRGHTAVVDYLESVGG